MAAVYSEKQAGLQINIENVSSENEKDSSPENSTDSASCEKDLSVENSGVGGGVRAGSPAPEAREHAETAAFSGAVPAIRIKEEPPEDTEYVAVHLDDVEEEDWDEQTGRGAHFAGRDEGTEGNY